MYVLYFRKVEKGVCYNMIEPPKKHVEIDYQVVLLFPKEKVDTDFLGKQPLALTYIYSLN